MGKLPDEIIVIHIQTFSKTCVAALAHPGCMRTPTYLAAHSHLEPVIWLLSNALQISQAEYGKPTIIQRMR